MAKVSRRAWYLYLAALVILGTGSVGTMWVLFSTGFPSFLAAFRRDPGTAAGNDPMSLVLFGVALVLVLLLVVLVVVFGAKNLPDPERDERAR